MSLVALIFGGRCLRAVADGPRVRLRAMGSTIDRDTVFERVLLPHDRVALRWHDGRYVTRRPDDGHNYGLFLEHEMSADAIFEEILWPDARISLRCADLTYVSVQDSGSVTANRVDAGSAERLTCVEVSPHVPGQRRRGESRPAPAPARMPSQAGAREDARSSAVSPGQARG